MNRSHVMTKIEWARDRFERLGYSLCFRGNSAELRRHVRYGAAPRRH
jgi:hypothetical protein